MKVYAAPEHIAKPEPDYRNYDRKAEEAKEDKYKADIKSWMLENGYTGKHTGELVYFPVADGNAQYMVADGKRMFLVHLDIGDAWHFREVEFLPKKEILLRLERSKNLAKLFGSSR